ncbi:GntR family transcriptional regulator [Jiella marina]|uniref:GntR family transcriptional regulator n=1 Tax=Jiella sp. LLJ827 TaxID=2917712 RepID=UPI002101CEB9|nr:GntR family transcriptional regulator [Jiella sp. LLJ827]MCQ0986082.1 GntR family transcriptional regulator [Jiella sp. LLJ827]
MNENSSLESFDDEKDRNTLTWQAYRALEESIVTLRLKPGEVLSENALAQQIGLGRTPVREAIQKLASEGLVVVLSRRGILVSEINISKHLQLLEVRRELERLVARSAAMRSNAKQRLEFDELAEGFAACAEADDDVTFMRLDRRFNRLTLEAARNEYASNAMRQIQGLSRRFWYQHYQTVLDLPRCARLHEAVAEAIGKGDPAEAATASDRLLDYIEEFARATI